MRSTEGRRPRLVIAACVRAGNSPYPVFAAGQARNDPHAALVVIMPRKVPLATIQSGSFEEDVARLENNAVQGEISQPLFPHPSGMLVANSLNWPPLPFDIATRLCLPPGFYSPPFGVCVFIYELFLLPTRPTLRRTPLIKFCE